MKTEVASHSVWWKSKEKSINGVYRKQKKTNIEEINYRLVRNSDSLKYPVNVRHACKELELEKETKRRN